ncbi:unnamed protein product [Brassicogethes aeneus]|uniref:NTF2 domain-containing protein n=1 Tax=Brassicogethes aeneus TaxID=1431903 RepID=A0A9P0FBA9_BRAAE|nr:unnamed protein product [Brassicogethes aeneus]
MISTNAKATHGLQEILSKFDDADLHILTTTVTQGLLKNKIKSRQEAINAILQYSPDAQSILKRKIVTKEILFSYLHEQNVPVQLPLKKTDLIEKIAEYWKLEKSLQFLTYSDSDQSSNFSSNSSKEKNDSELLIVSNDSSEVNTVEKNGTQESNVEELANQFVKWFYSMVNEKEDISEHFYPDAKCKITWFDQGIETTKNVENNPKDIDEVLRYLKLQNDMYFNPNFSKKAIQGRMDPHGLVMVLVCGTLHSKDNCIGVFEQVFALARDPFCDNNWKIKNTELNLRIKIVNALPSLSDSELTNNVLCRLAK